MGIRGIRNGTEDWRTAGALVPFCSTSAPLKSLVEYLNVEGRSEPNEIKIELFWKRIRDLRHEKSDDSKHAFESRLLKRYNEIFKILRTEVERFHGLKLPEDAVEKVIEKA